MRKTLSEEIYEVVKQDIIELRIKPGEKISEAKLAQRYNVSRAPIRNVIQKLQQEEFVLVKPQVGTIIMPISLKKAQDILQIRLLLETHAAETAAARVTDRDLEQLEASFQRLRKRQKDSEEKRKELFATDSLLHQIIWMLSGNREIFTIINNYRDETNRIRLSTLELANRLVPSEEEMKAIYRALKNRNPQEAREAMRVHIGNIMEAIESGIKPKVQKVRPRKNQGEPGRPLKRQRAHFPDRINHFHNNRKKGQGIHG